MRPLEAILAILLAAGPIFFSVWTPRSSLAPTGWAIFLFTTLLLHIATDKPHWQMAPVYLGVAIVLIGIRSVDPSSLLQSCTLLGLTVLAFAFSWVLPMFRLPAPTGEFAVGTRIVNPHDGSRELVVQIWYPAAASKLRQAAYRRLAETTWLSSYQAVLPTNARQNAPVLNAGSRFPVVLFSPAWGGRRTQNTFLAEELASLGFVVAGIDHPNNSGPMQLSDGRVLPPANSEIGDLIGGDPNDLRRVGDSAAAEGAADLRFVLDELERLNRDPAAALYGRLNTGLAGAVGHSFGGARSALACLLDARIRSAVDLDGWLLGETRHRPMSKPLMVIQEDQAALPGGAHKNATSVLDEEFDDVLQKTFAVGGGYRIFLHGATHSDFTDRPLFSPLRRFSGRGTISTVRLQMILRQYVVAFFDQTLRGRRSSMLAAGSTPFPEATLEKFGDSGK